MGPYTVLPGTACAAVGPEAGIPDYLNVHYWWAYVHPKAVRVFERQWLVNLILWGNFGRLRDAALAALGDALPGRTLQVACVYGDLTPMLSDSAARGGGRIDVVDVLPVQLSNLRRKLPADAPARLLRMDSTRPQSARRELRPRPDVLPAARAAGALSRKDDPRAPPRGETRRSDRHRRLRQAALVASAALSVAAAACALEPFALDLWRQDLTELLAEAPAAEVRASSFFGGLYRKVVVTRGEAETGVERLAA